LLAGSPKHTNITNITLITVVTIVANPAGEFEAVIAEHVTEGEWLGMVILRLFSSLTWNPLHWKRIWTARKVLRRMLEHEWEHLVELSERLCKPL